MIGPGVSLIVGLALTREAFERTLAEGDPLTHPGRLRAQYPEVSLDGLWRMQERYAQLAHSVIKEARGRGVAWHEPGTAAEAAALIVGSRVTTFVSHWRTAQFFERDIVNPTAVRRALARNDSPLRHLVGGPMPPVDNGSAADERARIARFLNARMDALTADELPSETDPVARPRRLTLQQIAYRHTRRLIQACLPAAFVGGDGIELAGRFWSTTDLVDRLPTAYVGLIDLTICNSVMFAEDMTRRCPDATVMANAERTHLAIRLALYRQIIARMDRTGEDYLGASYQVRRQIRQRRPPPCSSSRN